MPHLIPGQRLTPLSIEAIARSATICARNNYRMPPGNTPKHVGIICDAFIQNPIRPPVSLTQQVSTYPGNASINLMLARLTERLNVLQTSSFSSCILPSVRLAEGFLFLPPSVRRGEFVFQRKSDLVHALFYSLGRRIFAVAPVYCRCTKDLRRMRVFLAFPHHGTIQSRRRDYSIYRASPPE